MPAGRPKKIVTETDTVKAPTKTKKTIIPKAKKPVKAKEAKEPQIKPVVASKPTSGTTTDRKYFDETKAVKIIKEGSFYGLEGNIVSIGESNLPFKVDLGICGMWFFREADLLLI